MRVRGLDMSAKGWRAFGLAFAKGRKIITNRLLLYEDIRWVGTFRMRERWLFVIAILFAPVSLLWIITGFKIAINLWFGLGCLLICVAMPLNLWARGRLCLGVASESEIIVIFTDGEREKIKRILGLLRQCCPSNSVTWELGGTAYADADAWDHRPPSGRRFDVWRRLILHACFHSWVALGLFVAWMIVKIRNWAIDRQRRGHNE